MNKTDDDLIRLSLACRQRHVEFLDEWARKRGLTGPTGRPKRSTALQDLLDYWIEHEKKAR